jgi:hypothetical protein
MDFLGGDEGKALGEIEAHLVTEYAAGARAGSILLFDAVFEDATQ